MDNRSNEVLFDEGIRKAKELVSGYIFDVLTKCCEELIQDALDNKSGFRNLTGNTITSYACGLFMDGRFSYFVCSGDSMKQPVRVKLTKGETFVGVSYDNQNRRFTGTIETDKGYAVYYIEDIKTANEEDIRQNAEKAYEERVLNADVLTGTFQRAQNTLFKNFKPMK